MTALVDAHPHLWDPRRFRYPWPAELPAPDRPFVPAALDTGGHRLAGAVFVEAGRVPAQALAELRRVEEIAAGLPVLRGGRARGPGTRPRGRGGPAAPCRDAAGAGDAPQRQDEPPGFATSPGHVAGIRLLADHGLTADLCVRHSQLPEVTELVARVPEVTFVLDHLGKPPVRAGGLDPWREHIRRLAAHPNVVYRLAPA